jgi:hypothetical protein
MRTLGKLSLNALAVESFQTAAADSGEGGTVHGHARCTQFNSCYCPSSIYQCGTVRPTASCTGD